MIFIIRNFISSVSFSTVWIFSGGKQIRESLHPVGGGGGGGAGNSATGI